MKTFKRDLKKEIKDFKKIIAMKCLDCVCCQPTEVLKCEIQGCPLWEKKPKSLKGLYTYVNILKEKNKRYFMAEKRVLKS